MRLRILAVGTRMPRWVVEATDEYARRMPREMPLDVVEIAPGGRSARGDTLRAVAEEEKRLRARLGEADHVVALEVGGRAPDTEALAAWLERRRGEGRDVAFLIGGPDGLSPGLGERIDEALSLSPLTLPHGIARVVLAEQLYRAWTVLAGHPYHRAGGGSRGGAGR